MRFIDSHCHLDDGEFDRDRDEVIARARAAGVAQIIPAVDAEGWPKLRDICAQQADLFPAYGLHPLLLGKHRPQHLEALGHWLENEKPVAIGECGLDFFVDGLEPGEQQRYFQGQLELARQFDLPVIVHARRAMDAVLMAIRRVGKLRGVVHSFSGSPEQARQLWKLDFLIGLGGPVTYERAQRLRRIAADMPLDRLVLETDAPDQPDAAIRGERNEPARLPVICRTIARLRNESEESVAEATRRNAATLFGLPSI